MFPNGSLGAGRFLHRSGLLSVSREAVQISSRSANLRTRRAGNGITLAMRGVVSQPYNFVSTSRVRARPCRHDERRRRRVRFWDVGVPDCGTRAVGLEAGRFTFEHREIRL
jgi:hypothetical protein